MRRVAPWLAVVFLWTSAAIADDEYGGVYGTVADSCELKVYLRELKECKPHEPCEAARCVRTLVFGNRFDNPRLADFMVYTDATHHTYGPVLSSHRRYDPHLFGARQIYVTVFSETPETRYAVLTTLRPKTTTPIELALQVLGKIGAFSAAGEKADLAVPSSKTVDMRLLSEAGSCTVDGKARPNPPLYFGIVRFPLETDTSSHIGVSMAEAVSDWDLQRVVEKKENGSAIARATLSRSTTTGTTTVTEEIVIPKGEITDAAIARYAKVFDESVPARTAAKQDEVVPGDSDARATLDIAKFPVVDAAPGGSEGSGPAASSPTPSADEKLPPRVSLNSEAGSCDASARPCTIQLAAVVYGGEPPLTYDWSACKVDPGNRATATCTLDKAGARAEVTLKVTDKQKRIAWARTVVQADSDPPLPSPLLYRRTVREEPKSLTRVGGFFSNSDAQRLSVSVAIGGMRVRKVTEGQPTTTTTRDESQDNTKTTNVSTGGEDPSKNGTVTSTVENTKEKKLTTSQVTERAPVQGHLDFYVMGKLYLWTPWWGDGRPRLSARDGDVGSPYKPSVALTFGTNLSLDELVVGLSVGHIFDRVGITAGVNRVTRGKTFAETGTRLFFALDYSL